jgi:hypothetical protein
VIAYVFWHWPRAGVDSESYEKQLRTFHRSLRATPPPGFRRSSVRRLSGASWTPDGTVYEDWYLLDDTGALAVLGAGALSGSAGHAHDAVAGLAAGGTAGLYQPIRDAGSSGNGAIALWFTKPENMMYDALSASLEQIEGGSVGTLWRRMLVLGPTPEFCLLRNRPLSLPATWQVIETHRTVVWNPVQST